MASQGPLSPGTLANDSSVGTEPWSNPSNAASSDDSYASVNNNPFDSQSEYLKATNFGFSIPADATINGIVVEIERKASSDGVNNITDNAVRIVKSDGSIGTENKADTVSKWPTTDAYASYGGAADLWSESFTPADINDVDFGVVISVNLNFDTSITAFIDHFRITVHYTEATTTSTSSSTSTSVSTSSTSTSLSTSVSTSTTISATTSTSSTSTSVSTSVSQSTSTTLSITTSTSSTSVSTSSTSSSISTSTTLIDVRTIPRVKIVQQNRSPIVKTFQRSHTIKVDAIRIKRIKRRLR